MPNSFSKMRQFVQLILQMVECLPVVHRECTGIVFMVRTDPAFILAGKQTFSLILIMKGTCGKKKYKSCSESYRGKKYCWQFLENLLIALKISLI